MKWLFVTTRFPWPIVDGHWLRVYHLARTLQAQGDEVAVLSYENLDGAAAYAECGVRLLPGLSGSHVTRGRSKLMLAPYAFDQPLGRVLALVVTAASVDDAAAAPAVFDQFKPRNQLRLEVVWAVGKYHHHHLNHWQGRQRSIPGRLEIVCRANGEKGFVLLPCRWVAERTPPRTHNLRSNAQKYFPDWLLATTDVSYRSSRTRFPLISLYRNRLRAYPKTVLA